MPAGNLVIYVGKSGPKLTDNEVRPSGRELLPKVKAAWQQVLAPAGDPPVQQVGPKAVAGSGGADESDLRSYAAQLAELVSRAQRYGDQSGLAWDGLREAIVALARSADCPLPDAGNTAKRADRWEVWAGVSRVLATRFGWDPQETSSSMRLLSDD